MKLLYSLLLFIPIGLASKYLGGPALLTFAAAAAGVTPLAPITGEAAETLATRTGHGFLLPAGITLPRGP